MITQGITLASPWQLEWDARGSFKVDLLDEDGKLIQPLTYQNEGGLGASNESRKGTFVLRFEYDAPWGARITVAAPPAPQP